MSLVQRVTAIEGTDRELPAEWLQNNQLLRPSNGHLSAGYGAINGLTIPNGTLRGVGSQRSLRGVGSQRSLRRVISYDALAGKDEQVSAVNGVGVSAYNVSTVRRIAQVVATVLACWFASGIVFGFAALKPVLIDQGVYRESCTLEELEAKVEVCYEQDLRLNFFFAVASTTCNVSALPVGTILDRYGPRATAVLGSICLTVGSILMACAFQIPEFDGYLAGNIWLALGGTFIFVPSFSIANAFPKFSGMIVATVTGAFDASAAVFLFYRLAYESSGGTFTPDKFFFGYLIVPVLILVATFTLMTPGGYKTTAELEQKLERQEDVTQDVHDSDEDLSDREVRKLRAERREHRESKLRQLGAVLGDTEFRQEREQREEDRLAASGVWGALHGKPALQQMLSPWFILITLLTVLQMLRMNFFIATIRTQYESMLGSAELARNINAFFDVALPIGGVIATPFIGLLLDKLSTAHLLALLVALITACGALGSLSYLWAAYANTILFCLLRPLYYSAMSDYAAKVFGFATFGRVYGSIICFSGLVNLFQPGIDAINHDVFHDNPIPINVVLAGLGFVFGMVLVGFVWVEGRRVERKMAAREEEGWKRGVPSIMESEMEYD